VWRGRADCARRGKQRLRRKSEGLIAEGKKKIVLNMDNVTFIDSAGLGTLVAAHHSVKSQGAALRLCHLGSKFQEVLQINQAADRLSMSSTPKPKPSVVSQSKIACILKL